MGNIRWPVTLHHPARGRRRAADMRDASDAAPVDRLRLTVARIDTLAAGIARAAAVSAGIILVAMVGHVILEIVLRSWFSTSTFALDEFVGYGVAATTFLSAGYAFQENAFIRVSLALGAARRSARLGRGIELTCAMVTAAATWFVAWYFGLSVARHLARGTRSETVMQVPLWLPEGVALLGLAVLGLRILAYAARVACGGPLIDRSGPGGDV